jgi:two-component system, OmpR family, heavy metal sensor histidine kinase CusS
MNLKLKNRIALYYLIATAILTAGLFILIFVVIKSAVYGHLDEKLRTESKEVQTGLVVSKDSIQLINRHEWEEREHGQFEVNPIFLQIIDNRAVLIRKTENLFENFLDYNQMEILPFYSNSFLSDKKIRQLQVPLKDETGSIKGYLLIAVPMDEAIIVMDTLERILIIGFLAALILLFFVTRWTAERSILPIHKVISTAERITRENLYERIELPANKDEIYTLTSTVNGLLERLEDAVLREKQFTSDASHELRTPLSVLKGTLEVLIRKPRSVEQYEEKISYCIHEVNRMNMLIDQLLLLARYESESVKPQMREIDLGECIRYTASRVEPKAAEKGIKFNLPDCNVHFVTADPLMLDVVFENLLSNAVKYSNGSKSIDVTIASKNKGTVCSIRDYGIGMDKEEIGRIFDKFYRGMTARNTNHAGDGIGLAIVKRLVDIQKIGISYDSKPQSGTIATLIFSK